MSEPLPSVVALSGLDRVTSPDFPGVVRKIGSVWRVSVSMDCDKYLLQSRAATNDPDQEFVWMGRGRGFKTLSLMLASKHALECDGLAQACVGLPEDPLQAFPAFLSARLDLLAGFRLHDWSSADYGFVLFQDQNLRLVVDPIGESYRLQWVPIADMRAGPCHNWKVIRTAAAISEIEDHLSYVYDTDDWDAQPCPDLYAFCRSLPPLAADGDWPSLPARPDDLGRRLTAGADKSL